MEKNYHSISGQKSLTDLDSNLQGLSEEEAQKRLVKYGPNQIIEHIFNNYEEYHPKSIGIELTAFQKSLIYGIKDEMRRRNMFLPVVELKAERSKQERIEGLIPRYANGTIYHLQQCNHREALEDEFPKTGLCKNL